jgi:DNA-directed RNA polymerase specialized sigma24 family protein
LELAIARVEAKLDAIAKSREQARTRSQDSTESVARRALALVRELDTEQRLKEPSLLTVFHLYCVKELSAAQIARHCGCSKGTVIGRLRMLARKTGIPAAGLRRHSAQFERMEEEMRDWRAKEIHREANL